MLTEAFGLGTLWPYVRWAVAIACTVLAVELLYFIAPDVKYRFVSTLPGALIAVAGWIGLSYLLSESTSGIFPRTAAAMAAWEWRSPFSIWLYWTGFLVLVGAQFNAELSQEVRGRSTPEARRPAKPDLAA